MELSDKSKNVQSMFDKISRRYDFLNRLLSFQQDVRWRNTLIQNLPMKGDFANDSQGLKLIDVACGTGDVMLTAARKRPEYQEIRGYDISGGMISAGQTRADIKPFLRTEGKGVSARIEFFQASAESIPADSGSAHAVSIAFGLRNVDNRALALREFFRILKPNGKVFVLEFFKSNNSLFARIFDFYFKFVLPRIGGIFSDKAAYEYLPKSVSTMPEGSEFQRQLEETGFTNVKEVCWLAGATRLFIATKPK
jgi:demethylmenaquinone methyltransferase / 2-methoxy-6-polyprenyl-1,4-benzoquinol methylase